MESDWEGAYLLTLQAAWMADNREPNSLEASMAKAKAGRVGSDITLSCVELAGSIGYSETELLEKWARDSKILDIFEGTQQIQQLIVARRVLGLSSRRAQVASGAQPIEVVGTLQVRQRHEHGVDAPLGQRAVALTLVGGVPALVRAAYAGAFARPRSRSTRAQVSSRSRPTVGRSSTVTVTSSRWPRSAARWSSSAGRVDGTLAASPSVAATRRVRRPVPPTITGSGPTGRG